MLWGIVVLLVVWGLAYLVFAFVDPPGVLATYFKIPAILVFLPDRWAVTVGRLLLGVLILIGAGVFASRLLVAASLGG